MCDDLARLPYRETSAYDMCFYIGQVGAARTEAGYSVKERDCMCNVRSCRFAVTTARSAGSFDELRCNDRQFLCQRFVHRRVA